VLLVPRALRREAGETGRAKSARAAEPRLLGLLRQPGLSRACYEALECGISSPVRVELEAVGFG
jgi:hypothetical protein